KEIEEARKNEDSLTGVPSGFTNLDRLTGGWQKSDLVIVAARPGMGKTAFTLSLARNAAVDFNRPVAFFSLEMSAQQLVKRLISSEAELPAEKIIKGQLAEHEWIQMVK
ncbi:MAG TPA: replicative DNA helicase, partial [Bacteroidetes bacterium]|nr:replicative DNA helicase [Bacteroidota bacterium]